MGNKADLERALRAFVAMKAEEAGIEITAEELREVKISDERYNQLINGIREALKESDYFLKSVSKAGEKYSEPLTFNFKSK